MRKSMLREVVKPGRKSFGLLGSTSPQKTDGFSPVKPPLKKPSRRSSVIVNRVATPARERRRSSGVKTGTTSPEFVVAKDETGASSLTEPESDTVVEHYVEATEEDMDEPTLDSEINEELSTIETVTANANLPVEEPVKETCGSEDTMIVTPVQPRRKSTESRRSLRRISQDIVEICETKATLMEDETGPREETATEEMNIENETSEEPITQETVDDEATTDTLPAVENIVPDSKFTGEEIAAEASVDVAASEDHDFVPPTTKAATPARVLLEAAGTDTPDPLMCEDDVDRARMQSISPKKRDRVQAKPKSAARISDDTSMLKDFLNRAQARKAASSFPSLSTPTAKLDSPRRSARKPLTDASNRSASPKKRSHTTPPARLGSPPGKKPQLELNFDAEADSDDLTGVERAESVSATPPSVRRSGRTRIQLGAKPVLGAPSFIPVRRADGSEPVVLGRSEALETALVTRTNTRKNKGAARMPKFVLKSLEAEPLVSQEVCAASKKEHSRNGKKGKPSKRLHWDEKLVYYHDGDGPDEVDAKEGEESALERARRAVVTESKEKAMTTKTKTAPAAAAVSASKIRKLKPVGTPARPKKMVGRAVVVGTPVAVKTRTGAVRGVGRAV
jgi:hypothetical protein